MRNYIILNGQNSNEITGLLIQTLPPISQPKIRTNIEEIDGRDGDIITKLGYSAYNKEISIGLYGNYNVDDIIKYFTDNQSGKVTFSDEPDKYYYYEILDQVDFDKLIRYRTATVTLHCQPFKYSTTETKIQIDATEVSGSGSNITLNNTEDGALFTSLQINGDTSQDGTPTPSSPIPVNVVTGENTINICEKNLANIDEVGISKTWNNGTNTQRATIVFIPIERGQQYSLVSYWTNENITQVRGVLNNGPSDKINNAIVSGTFTVPSDKWSYISIEVLANTTFTNEMLEGLQIMLCIGTATIDDYEPYISQTYSIDLGSIELCKIGDYQDYIYKENGNWYLYKAIGKVVLDGTESGWYSQTQTGFYRYGIDVADINNDSSLADLVLIISNFFKGITFNGRGSSGYETIYAVSNNQQHQFFVNTQQYSTIAEFKTWLNTNNLIVYYVLATPTTTQITDTTLLSQLEALAGATTYLGQTNIITSGSTLNPLLEVTTFAVDDPSFVITNSGNINSKPIITIYGLGTVGLYLNGIQVLSLDMGETTSQITIDVAKLEAYNQVTGALMNRSVTGDYNNLSLNVGENTITESGTLQGLEIENYSRWL